MDFPSVVEIEINSQCNMSCSYCPNSVSERIEQGEMNEDIFNKILQDLKDIDYSGKIAFDFYNEPTLAKNFQAYTQKIKSTLPNCFIEIYSNGTKIKSSEDARKYIDWGVDKFIITKHEKLPDPYHFKALFENMDQSLKKHFEYRDHSQLILSNRGGSLRELTSDETLELPCHIPQLIMTITLKGNVLPCFEDFSQELQHNYILAQHPNQQLKKDP